MAVIDFTSDTPAAQQGMFIANWSGLTGGDTGQPLAYSNLADKTVQVFGDTVTAVDIQGSNDPRVLTDYENDTETAAWETLIDNFGSSLSFNANGLSLIAQAPRYIRPAPGNGSDNVTVIIISNAS